MSSDETMTRYGERRILDSDDTAVGSPLMMSVERPRWTLEDEIAVAMLERKLVKVLH